jgi:hypothetical protein
MKLISTMIEKVMSTIHAFFHPRPIEPGQRWTHKPPTPFSDYWIASVLEVKGGYVKYSTVIAPECMANCVIKLPPVIGYVRSFDFRFSYPIFLGDKMSNFTPPTRAMDTFTPDFIKNLKHEIDTNADITHVNDADFLFALTAINELRAEVDEARAAWQDERNLTKELQAKIREISGVISERHGDDGRFEQPEDEFNDSNETITIKRLFAIIENMEEEDDTK